MDSEGFLAEDVEAVLQGIDADGDVVEMRNGNEEGVDVAGADHFGAIGEVGDAGEALEPRGLQIADGGEGGVGDFPCEKIPGVGSAHVADADNTEADWRLHRGG